MMKKIFAFLTVVSALSVLTPADAVEVAPRITDREIIESLAELKAGQQAINKRIDDLQESTNSRLDDLNRRFDDLQESANRRFDDMNKRFDDLKWFLGTMIGVLMVMNSAVLGYVLKRQGKVESSLETVRDEVAYLKTLIERLLPPKGAL